MDEIKSISDLSELIYMIRGQKVVFDFDLAKLYEVENKALKRQVRSNIKRFPSDFMFQLNKKEWSEQVQKLHLLEKYYRIKSPPFAFTEQGVAMLSSVLRSDRAIEVNISIMRAFVELRKFLVNYEDIIKKISEFESDINSKLFEHDRQINEIFEVIKNMMIEDRVDNNRKIGFKTDS